MNNYNYYQNAYMGYPQGNGMQGYQQRPYGNQQPYVQQPQEMQIPIVDIKYVMGKKEVDDFIIFPNTAVLLIDKNTNSAYLKIANGNAQPTIRQFTYNELSQDGKPLNAVETPQTIDDKQFIKKTDIESLGLVSMAQFKEYYNKLVNDFNTKLKEIQSRIGGTVNGNQPNE